MYIDKHGWQTNLKFAVFPRSPSVGIGIGLAGWIGLTAARLLLTRTLFSKLPLQPFDTGKLG